jgi:hypothetical protein
MNVPKGSGDASLLDPASGGGRLWVGDRRTRRIYVLDASSGKRLGSFETDGRPDRVFYASGFVWFSTENSDSGSTLSKVNPSSFEVKGRTRIPHNAFPVSIDRVRRRTWMVLTRAFHLAGARHATWRVESRLWELGKGAQPFVVSDQSLGSTIQRGAVDPLVSDVEKWGDKLVLGRLPEFRMTWIRPASRKLGKSVFTKRFELPWEIEKVGSKLWVGNLNDEMLLEIDPATNERQIVTVGSETGSLTGGLGSLWVPLGGDDYWDDPGEVVRIDS